MNIKHITIRCHCGEEFTIERSIGRSMSLMLEFARCPNGHPRSVVADRMFKDEARCANGRCGVPIRLRDGRGRRGLCSRCYMAVLRNGTVADYPFTRSADSA